MSATPSTSLRSPLAENPWLWVMLFGAMGVAAILVVGPKYAARTARVERMQAMREKVASDRAAGISPAAPGPTVMQSPNSKASGESGPPLPREPYVEADFGPPTRLLWLLAVMAVVLVIGTSGLLVTRHSRRAVAHNVPQTADGGEAGA
ncbi:MAG: hypothetical protein QM775_22960 [Pirellulales bacterium]